MNPITITPSQTPRTLRHPWKRLVTIGRAYELLRHDLLEHLRILQERIGFDYTRFHAIFHDEMQVYTEDAQGRPVYQWKHVDKILDDTRALGLRHVIELNSMPGLLASGDQTIFNFKMNVTPPKSLEKWGALVTAFTAHLVERYGLAEIRQWYFECWNEPDLGGFWSGTMDDYFRFYAATARAVKAVHPDLPVGGPATSRGQWVTEFIRFCRRENVPLDFVSTHQYPQDEYCLHEGRKGSPHEPDMFFIDSIRSVRETVNREAGAGFPLFYTEWNTQNCAPGREVTWGRNPDLDTIYSGSSVLHYMTHLDGAADMFGWWTASDLFEFQDGVAMPTAPFSSGYGLLSVRGAPKPAFHALQFLSLMTGEVMETTLPPEHPRLANVLAVAFPDRVRLLVWNHQSNAGPQPGTWDARIRVQLPDALAAVGEVQQIALHVRPGQGAAYETWLEMGSPQNLTRTEEEALRLAAESAVSVCRIAVLDGGAEFELSLGRCEFAFIELSLPGQPAKERAEECVPDALNDLLSYRQPCK
ncbi:MAG: hypothetical protein WCS65_08895 [Verrucomicrobiae bacterium]